MNIVLFIVILLVVAALVAAAGDRMGHLAARRKIRFGGLRPRYVSTVIAVITGVLISLVTFGVLLAIWSDFRNALMKYDEVRDELVSAKAKLTSAQTETSKAQIETEQAIEAKNEAEQAMVKAQESYDKILLEFNELDARLATKEQELADVQKQYDAQKKKAQNEIAALNSRKKQLETDISGLETLVRIYQEADIIYQSGHLLSYTIIDDQSMDAVRTSIEAEINRLSAEFSQYGMKLSDDTDKNKEKLLSSYADYGSEVSTVLIARIARNVLQGGEVVIGFESKKLSPLLKKDEVVMSILVEGDQAKLTWLDSFITSVDVPKDFTYDSFADFIWQVQGVFSEEAIRRGFLPGIVSGSVETPMESLGSIYDNLVTRERPYMIQFVLKKSVNALDGLSDCEIYVSKWPPVPQS